MRISGNKIGKFVWGTALLCLCNLGLLCAQVPVPPDTTTIKGNIPAGSIIIETDSNKTNTTVTGRGNSSNAVSNNTAGTDSLPLNKDNAPVVQPLTKTKPNFQYHSPAKATWMSAALPGLGQFYNRRYWKPPIIYAGLGVAIYFLIDNQTKFVIARNSLRARMGVSGFTVADKYQSYDATQIESDREFYRTNRDYSIIGIAGVYALNIIDAVVDAHLRTFDVGDDLSMKFRPTLQYASISTQHGFSTMPGIAWTFKF